MNIDPRNLLTLGRAIDASKRVVAELDERDINGYVTLAKIGLWIVTFVLTAILVIGLGTANWTVAVQACQALVFVAATVLGFHEYKGSRILHVMRNLKGDDDDDGSGPSSVGGVGSVDRGDSGLAAKQQG